MPCGVYMTDKGFGRGKGVEGGDREDEDFDEGEKE